MLCLFSAICNHGDPRLKIKAAGVRSVRRTFAVLVRRLAMCGAVTLLRWSDLATRVVR
jgi:hypothetical protein